MTDNHKNQIKQLNTVVCTRIAPSTIHGVGVMALRDFVKGAKLYTDMGPVLFTLPFAQFGSLHVTVAGILLERWPNIVNGSRFIYPDTRVQAFMNHSDTPNYDAINDVVLRDIAAGEELTEDYRLIPGYELVFPWLVV